MPRRIQRKRLKGWRKPPGSVCVTRPGIFGNPYYEPLEPVTLADVMAEPRANNTVYPDTRGLDS